MSWGIISPLSRSKMLAKCQRYGKLAENSFSVCEPVARRAGSSSPYPFRSLGLRFLKLISQRSPSCRNSVSNVPEMVSRLARIMRLPNPDLEGASNGGPPLSTQDNLQRSSVVDH